MMALNLQILKSELMDLFATLQRPKSFLILDSRAIHHETWPYLVLAFQLQLQSRKSSVLHFPWSHGQQERLRSWGCHFHHAFMPCQLILSKYWHRKLYETVMSTCNSRKQSEIHSGSSLWIFIWNFHYALFSIQKVWPPFPNETITRIGTWWYQSTGFLTWLAIPSTSHFFMSQLQTAVILAVKSTKSATQIKKDTVLVSSSTICATTCNKLLEYVYYNS